MIRLLLTFILGTFLSSTFAQVTFFVKPLISINYHKGNNNRGTYSDNQPFAPNPYFQFVNAGNYLSNSLNLGLHVGMTLNKKHFFQLVMEQDNAGFANSVLINGKALYDTATYQNFFSTSDFVSIDIAYLRLSLQYEQILWKQKNDIFNLRISTSAGLQFNRTVYPKKQIYKVEYLNQFPPGQIGENIFITEHLLTSTVYRRFSPFISLGLGTDIKTKKKNNYLFSLDVYYLKGLLSFISLKDQITVMDNGQRIDYNYFSSSRGSGLYFQLSRRIQVYPLKSKKKPNTL